MLKKKIASFAKYTGLATVGVEWLALVLYFILLPEYFGGSYPISYYATLPETRFIFSVCYTLAGIFFWIFVRHHLSKFYSVPLKLFAISLVLFIALAWTPFSFDSVVSYTIHKILGLVSSVFFAGGMYIFARNSKDKNVLFLTNAALIASVVLLVAFIISSKDSPLMFVLEAGSWFVWQIWVLWISYYTFKNKFSKK